MMKYLFLLSFISITTFTYAQEVLPLYPSGIPNSKPGKDEETISIRDPKHVTIGRISRPTLTVFLAPSSIANGTAVVICPGGGYMHNAAGHEGTEVAKALNAMGVSAFVLKYRIPNDTIM